VERRFAVFVVKLINRVLNHFAEVFCEGAAYQPKEV
jgi:hypothetical protein